MVNRKKFLHLSVASAAGFMLPNLLLGNVTSNLFGNVTSNENANTHLANRALDFARSKGAAYADVRIAQHAGIYQAGIRAIVGGHWGFAYTNDLTRQGIENCVQEAMANASPRNSRHQYDLKLPHEVWHCTLIK